MCEDYRAGLGPDRAAGRRITAPLLVLWGDRDDLAGLYGHDVLGVWRPWAAELSGFPLSSGHHLAEEAPRELTRALLGFFGGPGSG
jgi:haloacetate dehalogenase